MKYSYLFIFALCTFLTVSLKSQAQTWQWAQSGGTIVDENNGPLYNENARSVTTDPYGNIYFISAVSYQGLIIDGDPKEVYGNFDNHTLDGLIASYACDGTYRWSKVIGSHNEDTVIGLGTDSQGNVYAAGTITPVQLDDTNPSYTHFDNDTILPASYTNVNTYKKSLYLVKYDSEGVLQWLRMPQKDDVSFVESITMYRTLGLQVDAEGNSYWLCHLGPGPVANGAYTVTGDGLSMHILKYDAEGNFVQGIPLPMQATSGALLNFSFKRNPGDGRFYVVGDIFIYEGSNESVTIAGQPVLNSKYVAAFDENGSFLWIRTNYGTINYHIEGHGLAFDNDNNVYYTTSVRNQSLEDQTIDGFNGQLFELDQFTLDPFPVLVKLDSFGNTLWQTNGNSGYANAVTVAGNEVAVTGGANSLTWQTQSYTYPDTQGSHPFLARFNTDTGTIISTGYLVSIGINDMASSISSDPNGSYYIGGRFEQILTANNTVNSTGGDYDFFLAKFGTDNCTLDIAENSLNELQLWPNPVKGLMHLNNGERLSYALYNILGAKVGSGTLEINGQLNLSGMAPGMYLLQLQGNDGNGKTIKVVKE